MSEESKKVVKSVSIDTRRNKSLEFNKKESVIKGIGEKTSKKLGLTGDIKEDEKKIKSSLASGEFKNIRTETYLEYKPLERIPRELIDSIKKKTDEVGIPFTYTGSYRRGKSHSGDIDVVLKTNSRYTIEKCLDELKKLFTIVVYEIGKHRVSILIKFKTDYVKMDIFVTDKHSYASMVLYTTGDYVFNIHMRQVAKRQKKTLNQYGIIEDNKLIRFSTEKSIFKYLNMSYVDPENRNYEDKIKERQGYIRSSKNN